MKLPRAAESGVSLLNYTITVASGGEYCIRAHFYLVKLYLDVFALPNLLYVWLAKVPTCNL